MAIAIHLIGSLNLALLLLPAFYVLLLRLLPARSGGRVPSDWTPPLSIIIPTHNEEKMIGPKLEGIFRQEYPPDRFEVIVVDDGSTDGTCSRLERFGERVRRVKLSPGRGKIAALNAGLEKAAADIIVITDADTRLEPNALAHLAAPLQDREVGAVSARLRIEGEGRTADYERAYVEAEHAFREKESAFSSVPFLFGQLSAFRKDVLARIPGRAAVDDLEIALRVRERGFRVIHREDAVVYETAPPNLKELLRQKVRRGVCTIEVVLRHLSLLRPRQGLFALTFFVRRVLPLFLPLVIIGSYAYLWFLTGNWWLPAALFGILGLMSWLKNRSFTEYMALVQLALLNSWWLYLTRRVPAGASWKQIRLSKKPSGVSAGKEG